MRCAIPCNGHVYGSTLLLGWKMVIEIKEWVVRGEGEGKGAQQKATFRIIKSNIVVLQYIIILMGLGSDV